MKQLRYSLSILLLIIHLLSGVSSAFTDNQQSLVTADGNSLMMICTGQGVRYVDLDVYYQTGQLVFVDFEPEQDANFESCTICPFYSVVDDPFPPINCQLFVTSELISSDVFSNVNVSFLKPSKYAYFSRDPPAT